MSINGETPDGQGMIHLRLRYIYNWHKYYTDLVKKTEEQINRLQEDIDDFVDNIAEEYFMANNKKKI